MLGGQTLTIGSPLETSNGSASASVRKQGFVLPVPTSGESNHPPNLFFHEAFIPQLRDRGASRGGVDGLPRQGDELMRVLFIGEDECDKESVLNVLPTHNAMLCT
jgi:cell wall assembly regulator SMI1